jgi:DNA polymerase-4
MGSRSELTPRICCLDLDTFFVSVERLLDPSLIGKPVVVGASPGQRGVVTAASYEVRALGVHSGMSSTEAERLAPHAIFLPTRHQTYGSYAKRVRTVLERFCPEVRTASIDEFYLDFRGCERLFRRLGDADEDATIERVVHAMRRAIQADVGLPASAGIGISRTVAKIASSLAKPAGVLMVASGQERQLLGPLPVRKYPGIGPVMEAKLVGAGIETLDQLVTLPPGHLRARFGGVAQRVRSGLAPQARTRLSPDRPAFLEYDKPRGTVGSISNERTFHADVGDTHRVLNQLRALTERVCWRARQRGVSARTVTLKLRFSNFHTVTRSLTRSASNAEGPMLRRVRVLFQRALVRSLPIRLVGVQLSNLVADAPQLRLPFGAQERPLVGAALDAVRDRFGYDAIRLGAAGTSTRWLSTPAESVAMPG